MINNKDVFACSLERIKCPYAFSHFNDLHDSIINDGNNKIKTLKPKPLLSLQLPINADMTHLLHCHQMKTRACYYFGSFQCCKQKKLS